MKQKILFSSNNPKMALKIWWMSIIVIITMNPCHNFIKPRILKEIKFGILFYIFLNTFSIHLVAKKNILHTP